MNLSFQTKWPQRMGPELAGKPNYFVEKIWACLLINEEELDYNSNTALEYVYACEKRGFNATDERFIEISKPHTIRRDQHDRWKAGNKIHFQINPRSPQQFRFAPVIECTAVQEIKIEYAKNFGVEFDKGRDPVWVSIDGRALDYYELERLSVNDGFPNLSSFFYYFNENFTGKIIHWTDLKY